MRYRLASVAILLVASGCSSNMPVDSASTQARDFLPGVPILYSANIGGEIEPCGCRTNPTGGVYRRLNLIRQQFSGENLSLDSGDLFYKSIPVPLFLAKQWDYQAEVLVQAYNTLGVEVMAPGELDFAGGLAQFKKLLAASKFKAVSANIYQATGKRLLEPYVILKKGGKKVGIFGVFDETLPLPAGLTAKDHLAAAKSMVSELRKKTDVLIALTHLGLEKDQELARSVSGIDAIFGAHTQSFLFKPEIVGDTVILQTSFRGQHLGVYSNGENSQYQIDARFDSPEGHPNALDTLAAKTKEDIARLNRETETELLSDSSPHDKAQAPSFQTFASCIQCHAPQYKFHRDTAHFKAYETLVKAKQNANLDCLKCHTVGAQQPGGWSHVDKLVLSVTGKPVNAESFAKSLPKMNIDALTKVSKAFINVQCETCHGAGGEHPFSGEYSKKISTTTCLQCHTPNQAPGWYKNGKPDADLIKAKLKTVSCPPQKN